MLSYQHGYHAGNLADLHKHRVLAEWLVRLTHESSPITYIETHAGRGVYDLCSDESRKTGEAQSGIERSLNNKELPDDHPYYAVIQKTKKRYGASWYPGSPTIARQLLREQDMLHLFELHPQEYAALKARIRAKNIRITQKDGYAGALSLARAAKGRGLVLIDPSYEVKHEYDLVVECVRELHNKWPQAAVLVWYPILEAGLHRSMVEALSQLASGRVFHDEAVFPPDSGLRMQGSGLWGGGLAKRG